MPNILMSDAELADATHAAQLAKKLASDDAAKQSNPGVRQIFDRSAARFDALAIKFSAARAAAKHFDTSVNRRFR